MLRILVFIALASALAFGAVWLAERPGEVSIVWGGYTIETTVAMAAIGVAVLILLGMLLWTVLRFMLGLPTAFSFASKARKRARGFDAVSRGMVAIGAGDQAAARRHANDAQKLIAGEPLTLLLTAQAAQLSGDKPAADAAFKRMLDEPATRVLGLRGLFVEARRRGDLMSARTFADEAVRLAPSLAWANDALLEFHSTNGDWAEARTAVERRAALRLSDKVEAKRHRAVLLAAEALGHDGKDPALALSTALAALKLAPGLVPAASLAARLLGERGELRKAARIIEAAWREQPHPDLASTYINLRHGDTPGDKLVKAEALMKLKPTDPESAFVVAEAAIGARDFARARGALSPLLAAVPTVRSCLLMARIEDAEHGTAGRGREWLTRSTRAPRDNAWVADGVVSETWMPVSPVSGRLDAFAWTLPPPILGSAAPLFDEESEVVTIDEPRITAPPIPARPETVEPAELHPRTAALPPAASLPAMAISDIGLETLSAPAAMPDARQKAGSWSSSHAVENTLALSAKPAAERAASDDHAIADRSAPAKPSSDADASLRRPPDDPGPEADVSAKTGSNARRSFWPFGGR